MANRTETLKLIISGDGRLLDTELGRTETQVKGWGGRVGGVFSGISNRISSTVKSIITNPLAIVGGTAGILYAGKQLMDYDAKLTRLGITAEISAEEVLKLREELGNIAISTGQSRTSLLAGLDKFVEQTGDLEYARGIMKDLGVASSATGAEVEHLAALTVQLRDKFKLTNTEVGRAMNLLTVQGKSGAFTLQNMAEYGERLFAAASRFDMAGMKQLGSFGAMMQIARMGSGSSAQATTSIEGVFADILDKQKEIRKLGFNIFKSPGQLKSYEEIVKGIIVATKGSETKLGDIFGRQSIRGISVLAKMYRDTNGFALFDKLAGADADKADALMQDFLRYATSLEFQLKQMGNIGWDFMESALTPLLGEFNSQIKELTSSPEKLEQFRDDIRQFASSIGELTVVLGNLASSPAMDVLSALADMFGLTTKSKLTKQAQTELKKLSKTEQKIVRSRVESGDWDTGLYSVLQQYKHEKSSIPNDVPPDILSRYFTQSEPAKNWFAGQLQELHNFVKNPLKFDQKITVVAPEGTRVSSENNGGGITTRTETNVNRGAF